jgi:hypothetical protein
MVISGRCIGRDRLAASAAADFRSVCGLAIAFGAVCRLILTSGALNSPLRALSGRHCAAFEHDQAAHVVGEVCEADLGGGAQDADSADELAAHAAPLVAEHILDPRPHL